MDLNCTAGEVSFPKTEAERCHGKYKMQDQVFQNNFFPLGKGKSMK